MPPEQAVELCSKLKRPSGRPTGTRHISRPCTSTSASRPNSFTFDTSQSKEVPAALCRAHHKTKDIKGTNLPWKQRQSLQLVPNSHRDFLMQTKPQMEIGRAQTPPLISSRSSRSATGSVKSQPKSTSRS